MLKDKKLLWESDLFEELNQQESELIEGGGRYFATKLTRVAAGKNGEFLITWAGGAPTPSPCGTGVNWGWVLVPDNNQKDLALFAYLNEKPVRIDTHGCTGNFERVGFLFVG